MPFISAGICKAVNLFTEPIQLQMNKLLQLMVFSGAIYSYSLCRREVYIGVKKKWSILPLFVHL